jgi:amino acid adenylation domain-containing protein
MTNEAIHELDPEAEDFFAFPASFAQQRLWFVDQLAPGKAIYNIPYHHQTRLRGPLNVPALTQALNELVARHEPLRTTFATEQREPVQIILPEMRVELPIIDLSDLEDSEREAEMQRIVNEEARHTFDLEKGPLFYAKLLKLAENDHIFIFMIHHITVDALSLDFFAEEIATLYEAFATGKPSPLPELPIQYADFVIWQREWMQGDVLKPQMEYWLEQLKGNLPVSELPTDRPRPKRQQNNGSWEWFHIPPTLGQQLSAFSRKEGVSLYMTMLAGFKALLHRYSGHEEIVVSSPTANRTQPELEKLIAFFINPVILRTTFADDPTFRTYLKQVRKVALGAFANQELPFDQLVEALQPPRDLSYHPLFQVSFTLQGAPVLINLPGLQSEAVEFDNGTAKFDLTAELWETEEGGVSGRFEYDTDLFDQTTIERLMKHYQQLLAGLTNQPDVPMSQIPVLAAEEQAAITQAWNNTQTDYASTACLHQLFEKQAAERPQSIAIKFEDQTLTYQELNERANKLAHYLQALGIGPDQFVGLCVERSPEMMVGLLGILKAGGAYLPMDPEYPAERLAFMLEDTQASILLTQERLLDILPQHEAQVIRLDSDWSEIAKHSDANPVSQTTPENLAYVIHTSGSTGQPKGVLIPQRNVVNFLEAMRRRPGLSDTDKLLAVTTLSFDIAVLELFLPLVTGAQLVIASRPMAADGRLLAQTISAAEITIMQATPASWQMLLNSGWQPNGRLKMLSGGEALPRKLANELLANGGELWNMYGPTETTIWSSVWQVQPGDGPILIGRPIANTQMYVLDKHLNPVPIGVTGELYIGGDGVARGYLNRPELTEERFVDLRLTIDDLRLYRTGDLARTLPDGNIECLGRVDFQVKVRGFRIELGEIEAVLSQHTAVNQAVVIATGATANDKRLVAYTIAEPDVAVTSSELRNYLLTRLPQYMVPAHFIDLETFPLTPNGKVDRLALPDPDQSQLSSEENYVAPTTDMEQALSQMWSELLQIERIGTLENFFELGGHSLMATQMMARLRDELKVDLPLATLFESPIISDFARQIEVAHWATQGTETNGHYEDDEREEFEL